MGIPRSRDSLGSARRSVELVEAGVDPSRQVGRALVRRLDVPPLAAPAVRRRDARSAKCLQLAVNLQLLRRQLGVHLPARRHQRGTTISRFGTTSPAEGRSVSLSPSSPADSPSRTTSTVSTGVITNVIFVW